VHFNELERAPDVFVYRGFVKPGKHAQQVYPVIYIFFRGDRAVAVRILPKKPETRAARIKKFIEMLANQQKLYP